MYLESKSLWIAQRSVKLQWVTKAEFTSSRIAKMGYTIMALRMKTIPMVKPINLIPQLLRIIFKAP